MSEGGFEPRLTSSVCILTHYTRLSWPWTWKASLAFKGSSGWDKWAAIQQFSNSRERNTEPSSKSSAPSHCLGLRCWSAVLEVKAGRQASLQCRVEATVCWGEEEMEVGSQASVSSQGLTRLKSRCQATAISFWGSSPAWNSGGMGQNSVPGYRMEVHILCLAPIPGILSSP